MTTEHTPGPWEWRNHNGQFVASKFSSLIGPDGDIVIDDGSASGSQTQIIDPYGPDAKLIAAAPDLLSSVMDLLTVIAGVSGDTQEILLKARAAVIKATR